MSLELNGFCERCHRFQRVTVRLGLGGPGGLPSGICAECRDITNTEKETNTR